MSHHIWLTSGLLHFTSILLCLFGYGCTESPVLYFADDVQKNIFMMPVNASTFTKVILDNTIRFGNPWAVGYDPTHRFIYWTDRGNNNKGIGRFSMETNEVKFLTSASEHLGITVDYISNKVYTSNSQGGYIEILDFENGIRQTVPGTASPRPAGIAVDPEDNWIYWCDEQTHKIERAKTDGTLRQELDPNGIRQLPYGIALDKPAKRLYFCAKNLVESTNLDGNDKLTHYRSNVGYTFVGIAVDAKHIYVTSNKHSSVFRLEKAKTSGQQSLQEIGQASSYKDRLYGLVLTGSSYLHQATTTQAPMTSSTFSTTLATTPPAPTMLSSTVSTTLATTPPAPTSPSTVSTTLATTPPETPTTPSTVNSAVTNFSDTSTVPTKNKDNKTIIYIVIGVIVGLAILLAASYLCATRKCKSDENDVNEMEFVNFRHDDQPIYQYSHDHRHVYDEIDNDQIINAEGRSDIIPQNQRQLYDQFGYLQPLGQTSIQQRPTIIFSIKSPDNHPYSYAK